MSRVPDTTTDSGTVALAAPAERQLAVLEPERSDVERVLGKIPDNRLQARRIIQSAWGFEPTADELRTIVRIAHDPVAAEDRPRELSRAALAARLATERRIHDLLQPERLDAERMGETAAAISKLRRAVETLLGKLTDDETRRDETEREFLVQVTSLLCACRAGLIGADALAPRLEKLAAMSTMDEIRASLPGLTEAEVETLASELFAEAVDGAEPASHDPAPVRVGAIALSAIYRHDLSRWKRARTDTAPPGERKTLLERVKQHLAAYTVVWERLERLEKSAALAGRKKFASRLGTARLRLGAAHRELVSALGGKTASTGPKSAVSGPSLESLLEESAAQDAMADAERANQVSAEEACLDALKQAETRSGPRPTPRGTVTPRYDLARERLRIRILSSIAAVMLIGCVTVWGLRLRDGTDPLAVPQDEISDVLILDHTFSVGPMMYGVVSHWSWDSLTEAERLNSVQEVGSSAETAGYETVYLVDENRQELAMWTRVSGAKLLGPGADKSNPAS